MYEIFEELRQKSGVSVYKVAKAIGESTAMFSNWKAGRYTPKADKLQKVADYFGVSLEYLMTGEESDGYYLNPETAKLAQEMFEDPDMRMLFDLKRDIDPELFKAHIELMRKLYEASKND